MSYLRESWLRPLVLSGDMWRNRGFVLLTIYSFITHVSTERNMIYTDGWIPMSHNDVYNQIKWETPKYPVYLTTTPSMDYKNTLKRESGIINAKNDFKNFKPSLELLNEKHLNADKLIDQADNSGQFRIINKENSRKSKMVVERNLNDMVNNILVLDKTDSMVKIDEEVDNSDKNSAEETSNTYEVTEDTDKSITEEENSVTEFIGYQYNRPSDENQNLTSTFLKILSKYNIKSDDKLQNYNLSLQRKIQNSLSVYQIPLPYRYNSLNHLPVDPLLAVFLSNYGFYLPSFYGIKSNYNNLYGYLASNNIHNNKPFGLYKIFSDTDSSN